MGEYSSTVFYQANTSSIFYHELSMPRCVIQGGLTLVALIGVMIGQGIVTAENLSHKTLRRSGGVIIVALTLSDCAGLICVAGQVRLPNVANWKNALLVKIIQRACGDN